MTKITRKKNDTSANLGFEADLWRMADALRSLMDAAEYKHVVLGQLVDDAMAGIERDNPALRGVPPVGNVALACVYAI